LLPAIHRAFGLIESFPETIRRHVDNLWILGGEIIRDLNYTPSLRKVIIRYYLDHPLEGYARDRKLEEARPTAAPVGSKIAACTFIEHDYNHLAR
jgi:hypothetical protein